MNKNVKNTLIGGLGIVLGSAGTFALTQKDDAPGYAAITGVGSSAAELSDDVAAVINGKALSEITLQSVLTQMTEQGQTPDREKVLTELINLEVITQAAEAAGVHEQPETAAALRLQYTQSMASAFLAEKGEAIEVTDEEAKAEYDRETGAEIPTEFNASHILLESEEDAKAVIEELNNGADFATLAKERSTGPSNVNGGNLGWFQAQTMVPEFSLAVLGMKKDEISTAPVKTDFGWHVIKLNDTRTTAKPAFDTVKEKIKEFLVRNRLTDQINELVEKADVKRPVVADATAEETTEAVEATEDAAAEAMEETQDAAFDVMEESQETAVEVMEETQDAATEAMEVLEVSDPEEIPESELNGEAQ